MNNRQASNLPIGTRIRRKGAGEGAEVCRVEHIERPENHRKDDVIIRAGGHAFRAWEIEQIGAMPSWSKEGKAT